MHFAGSFRRNPEQKDSAPLRGAMTARASTVPFIHGRDEPEEPLPQTTNTFFHIYHRGFRSFRRMHKRLKRRLWYKPAMVCVFAVLTVVACYLLQSILPNWEFDRIVPGTVADLLTIISSSMLAVATFSFGSMMSAYSAAASSATPRAFELILEDDTSRNAFASFLGAFIFSVVGIVGVKSTFFHASGILFMFLATICLFGVVVYTFLSWSESIARLGQIETAIEKCSDVARRSLLRSRAEPGFGGMTFPADSEADGLPTGLRLVPLDKVGYLKWVDVATINAWAERTECHVWLLVRPGHFVSPLRPVIGIQDLPDGASLGPLRTCFEVGATRSYHGDPVYACTILSEIASRALSPGINDPGTAASIVDTYAAVLYDWLDTPVFTGTPRFLRVHMPELPPRAVFSACFDTLMRDGGGTPQVLYRLMECFWVMMKKGDDRIAALARQQASRMLEYADRELKLEVDKEEVRQHARAYGLTGSRVFADFAEGCEDVDCPAPHE